MITSKRVCPQCHNDLPGGYANMHGRIIALVGPKTSGKSTYTTILVRELRTRVGNAFDSAVNVMDDRTAAEYADRERRLYDEGQLPAATAPAGTDLVYPLLFRFTLRVRRFLRTRSRSSSLVFFDTAGEDLETADSTARHVHYLAEADGIILLVDPLQFGPVRDALNGRVTDMPKQGTPPDRIVAIIGQLIRDRRNRSGGSRLDIPLAVALTKVDLLPPLLDEGSRLLRCAWHDGALDRADLREVDDEVRAHLQDWDEGALRRQVEADFSRHAFFALSALGGEPDMQDHGKTTPKGGIRPIRPEDPVLWLFHLFGLIRAKKEH
ncbi:hypothetical protein AB0I81_57535 [Nonomuraea sp. NPDC050404]|uniref:TRAFAC clade GTPase domain-containing protein n=1 Tax=Nonomuraea sp. NPDC050404 TaxID=3155783 RepID=UPI0033FBD2C8